MFLPKQGGCPCSSSMRASCCVVHKEMAADSKQACCKSNPHCAAYITFAILKLFGTAIENERSTWWVVLTLHPCVTCLYAWLSGHM